MNVKQLKSALENYPDDMQVYRVEDIDHPFEVGRVGVEDVSPTTVVSYNKQDPHLELTRNGNVRKSRGTHYTKKVVLIS